MLTREMEALLRRTLPVDQIDADRIVLRGPVNRGAEVSIIALAINPAFLVLLGLLVGLLVVPAGLGEDLAERPHFLPLLPLILMSVVLTIASIIWVRRRRTLRIALHRGQYLAHFYGPKGIDICLPLVQPFMLATATASGKPTIWKSPAAYKDRQNRTPWERLIRFWPMGRIPTLGLCFPERDWITIVPVPGAHEADFIACWEWLLHFIVPARASTQPAPPRRVLRLAGAANMLSDMALHSFTDEKLGLFWTTTAGGLFRTLTGILATIICGIPIFSSVLGGFDGLIPLWVALASCPLSTASAILVSFRAFPTVTTFTRGMDGAYIEQLRGRERIPEFRISFRRFDNLDQIVMVTPRGTLRGRSMWVDFKPIALSAVFIDSFCKPPVETEGIDVDV